MGRVKILLKMTEEKTSHQFLYSSVASKDKVIQKELEQSNLWLAYLDISVATGISVTQKVRQDH